MPTDDAIAAAAAEAGRTLLESARSHKRLANFHRRESRRQMERFADLRAQCARAGIDFDDGHTTKPEEAQS